MKTLRDYIIETETWVDEPAQGDNFEFDIREGEYVIETYIVDTMEDGIVVQGDDRVMALLEEAGYTFEEIKRYGAVGSSRGMGFTMGESDMQPLDHQEEIEHGHVGEDRVSEGAMKHEMMKNAERMSLEQFKDRYGDEDWIEEFYKNVNPDDETEDNMFDRVLELAGCGRRMEEDQDAEVLAQKDMAAKISAPFPNQPLDEDPTQEEPMSDAPEMNVRTDFPSGLDEADYQGRKVELNKPMAGDVKKSKVYVKGPKGNVVKVNFGDKTMRIKKSNPARRKSFRARHNCENPGPKWKARYWSCRAW